MDYFTVKTLPLQSGMVLPDAQLAFDVSGTLNSDASNLVLLSTAFGSTIYDHQWMIGADSILDPNKYCIVTVALLGNGESSSPTTVEAPFGRDRFPLVSMADNVEFQALMLDEVFEGADIALAIGWSMGAQLALHWAVMYPERVKRVAAICGTASTSIHNQVFLEGVKAILSFALGDDHRPDPALRALGRFYAGWAVSQGFYRKEKFREFGYQSLEDYLVRDWEANFIRRDPYNLAAMAATWQAANIGVAPGHRGDNASALRCIEARTLLMPCQTDLYFTVEDAEIEASLIQDVDLHPIASDLGHRAGNPKASDPERAYILENVVKLLKLDV